MATNNSVNYKPVNNAVLIGSTNGNITSISVPALANQVLLSGASSMPSWSTATYLSTTNANNILYSSSTNVIGEISTVNNGVLITNNSGVPSFLANSTTPGWVLTANASAPPSWQAAPSGGNVSWTDQSSSFAASVNNAYFISGAATATLPASPSQGNLIKFTVDTASAFVIKANTGQIIRLGSLAVSTRAGTLTNSAIGDSITLIYRTVGAAWISDASIGTWNSA